LRCRVDATKIGRPGAVAAIVLNQNAALASRNLLDFQRVPGLLVEDWSH
jgi:predicted nucleic acid-binding protein